MKKNLLSLASLLAVLNAKAIENKREVSGGELSGFAQAQKNLEATDVSQMKINLDFEKGPASASVDFDVYDSSVDTLWREVLHFFRACLLTVQGSRPELSDEVPSGQMAGKITSPLFRLQSSPHQPCPKQRLRQSNSRGRKRQAAICTNVDYSGAEAGRFP